MLQKMIFAAAMIFIAAACANEEIQEGDSGTDAFLKEDTPGLYQNSEHTLVYDKDIYQYAFNTKRHTFMIQNNAQSRYLRCSLEDAPVTDSPVNVEITTKGITGFEDTGLTMQTLKEENGKYWLYDPQSGTGLIIILE